MNNQKLRIKNYGSISTNLACLRNEKLSALLANAKEALNLYLDEPENSKVIFLEPKNNLKAEI